MQLNCPRCNRELDVLASYKDSPVCRRCVIKLAVPREFGYARDALIDQLRYEQIYVEVESNKLWSDARVPRHEAERQVGMLQRAFQERLTLLTDLDQKIEESMNVGLIKIKAEWPSERR